MKKKNKITKLKGVDNLLTEDVVEMGRLMSDFYKELYTFERTMGMERVLQMDYGYGACSPDGSYQSNERDE
jgi:hypothetical protein